MPPWRPGGDMPAVLNAANEIAVAAFLRGTIGFLDIPRIIDRVMQRHQTSPLISLEQVLLVDAWARQEAEKLILKEF